MFNSFTTSMKNKISKKKSAFAIFMIEEYKNISNAHYNTGSSISQFFRYYLLLMSVVIAVLPVLFSYKFAECSIITNHITEIERYAIPLFLISFSLIGTWTVFYMTGLKANETLYARTVNGVRKYFKNEHANDIMNVEEYLCLPTDTSFPKSKYSFFRYIVWSMVLINALYFFTGIFSFAYSFKSQHTVCFTIIDILICIFLSCIVMNYSSAIYKEHLEKFRSNIN